MAVKQVLPVNVTSDSKQLLSVQAYFQPFKPFHQSLKCYHSVISVLSASFRKISCSYKSQEYLVPKGSFPLWRKFSILACTPNPSGSETTGTGKSISIHGLYSGLLLSSPFSYIGHCYCSYMNNVRFFFFKLQFLLCLFAHGV